VSPRIIAILTLSASIVLAGCVGPDETFRDGTLGAGFTASTQHIPLGQEVVLAAADADEAVQYTWDLGDGTTKEGANVTHTYKQTGTYDVTLTARAPRGVTATSTMALHVGEAYVQEVWFNWDTTKLDILILGVTDPIVGAAIQEAIDSWHKGIVELLPELGAELEFRVHWPVIGGVPPAGPHITFAPFGYWASYDEATGTCQANAPVGYLAPDPTDFYEFYFTSAHEFGHCLGLSHVFHRDVEYEPRFDLLGGGSVQDEWGKSCPSNLNAEILRMVFGGEQGTVIMSSTEYYQAAC
jgi:hypothetical protein